MVAIKEIANQILELSNELAILTHSRDKFNSDLNKLKIDLAETKISQDQYKISLASMLKDKNELEWKDYYTRRISFLLENLKKNISQLFYIVEPNYFAETKERIVTKSPEFLRVFKNLEKTKTVDIHFKKEPEKQLVKEDYYKLSKDERLKYLSDLKISERDFEKFIKTIKKNKETNELKEKGYSVYESGKYAKLANTYVEKLTIKLTTKYPKFFDPLSKSLRPANIKMLSKTYISILIFSTIISFPVLTLLAFLIFLSLGKALLFGFLGMVGTFIILYFYPDSVIRTRNKKIKAELVFAVPHMSAVAGSGAPPLQIFKLIVESGDYKEVGEEIKHILNYVNLFGYSLSTATKLVAKDTPSREFKELLNGIVSIIETGGDLKQYLSDKADDSIRQYRIDQAKYLAQISTYSDVYTGVLIAAPLLFIVTLAVLEKISPTIGGMSVGTVASTGTFVLLPVLNLMFILFLEMTKSEI